MEENVTGVDYKQVWNKIWERKMLYVKVIGITFVLACLWIFPQPRDYETSVSLAPETGNSLGGDAISSLASTFGFDVGGLQGNDAIYPTLYPEIVKSSYFIVSLFDVKVTTGDGKVTSTYYDYLLKHHRINPYFFPVYKTIGWVMSLIPSKEGTASAGVDPFKLTRRQYDIVTLIGNSIECKVDKKTDVITITVADQDAYVSACLADTVRQRLQNYITDYRTKKARHDMEYYDELAAQAWVEYNQSMSEYSSYKDSHMNTLTESVRSVALKLERTADVKYNTFSVLNNQLQAAKARLQERTPAFTIIQPATVPIRPVRPKRIKFVFLCMFLAFAGTSVYVLKDILN